MLISSYKVHIIIDPEYGEKIRNLPEGEPVWVVESSINYPIIQSLWEQNILYTNHLTGITSFQNSNYDSNDDILLSMIDSIEDHHGEYSHDPPYNTRCYWYLLIHSNPIKNKNLRL